jgi:hypothetical protein
MISKCEWCDEPINSSGNNPKKYCTDKCRKAHKRNHASRGLPNPDTSTRTNPTRTVNPDTTSNPGVCTPELPCQHCLMKTVNGSKKIINHGPHIDFDDMPPNTVNRVALPGDADYTGVAVC